jgi:hypothetical protein
LYTSLTKQRWGATAKAATPIGPPFPRHTATSLQLDLDSIIHIGRCLAVSCSQQDITDPAVLPLQLRTLAASALLPNESMLKSAAAPNAAAAENLWVLVRLVIFLLLGFAILFDRWCKYGKIRLIHS